MPLLPGQTSYGSKRSIWTLFVFDRTECLEKVKLKQKKKCDNGHSS